MPPEARRRTGVIHGGALSTAFVLAAERLSGAGLGLLGMHANFFRPVAETDIELELHQRVAGLVEGSLLDQKGRSCMWALVRLGTASRAKSGCDRADAIARSSPAIDDPWRSLLDLDVAGTGDSYELSVGESFSADWTATANALTFTDAPGATLAHERAQGAEFVTTSLTLDLARPLSKLPPRSARGSLIMSSNRFRTFLTHIDFADGSQGTGTAVYFRTR